MKNKLQQITALLLTLAFTLSFFSIAATAQTQEYEEELSPSADEIEICSNGHQYTFRLEEDADKTTIFQYCDGVLQAEAYSDGINIYETNYDAETTNVIAIEAESSTTPIQPSPVVSPKHRIALLQM